MEVGLVMNLCARDWDGLVTTGGEKQSQQDQREADET